MSTLPEVFIGEKKYENYPIGRMSRMEAEEKIREAGPRTVILRRSDNSLQANPNVYFVVTQLENRNLPSSNTIVTKKIFDQHNGKLERMVPSVDGCVLWLRDSVAQEYSMRP